MNRFFSYADIRNSMPQRSPFLMLDRAEQIDDTHYQALKAVSINEAFFQGHFPGHPIMPGVLQLEAMKQLAELALHGELDPEGVKDIYLQKADKVKFRRPVVPGDRIKIEIEITGKDENGAALVKGTVSSAGGVTCQAMMTIAAREKVFQRSIPELPNCDDLCEGVALDVNGLMNTIPHRFPFLLVDYIYKSDGNLIQATKNLTGNEPFFREVPADFPVIPEAFLCEISAQAGCSSVLAGEENKGKIGVFMAIDKAESFAPVGVGDQLVIRSVMPPTKAKFGKGSAEIFCENKLVFKVTMMFAIVDA